MISGQGEGGGYILALENIRAFRLIIENDIKLQGTVIQGDQFAFFPYTKRKIYSVGMQFPGAVISFTLLSRSLSLSFLHPVSIPVMHSKASRTRRKLFFMLYMELSIATKKLISGYTA